MNACFHLGAIVNSASMTIHIHIFVFQYFSGICSGVGCLGHSVILYGFWGISNYITHLSSPSDPHPSALFQTHHFISATMKLFHFVRSSGSLTPGFSIYHFLSLDTFIFSGRLRQLPLKLHLKKNVFSDPLVKLRCTHYIPLSHPVSPQDNIYNTQ